jgi:hypothetical protein
VALPPPGPTLRLRAVAACLVRVGAALALLAGCTTGSAGQSATTPVTPPTNAPTGGTTAPLASTAGPTPTVIALPTTVTTSAAGSAPGTGTPGGPTHTVQITFSGWDQASHSAQVNALVPDVVTQDGQCTLVLTLNGVRRTTTVPGHPTPEATSCGLMSIPGSQLTVGAWQAVVTFRASEGTATSKAVTIQVPA